MSLPIVPNVSLSVTKESFFSLKKWESLKRKHGNVIVHECPQQMIKETERKKKGWSWFFMSDERLWLCLCACGILMGFVDDKTKRKKSWKIVMGVGHYWINDI